MEAKDDDEIIEVLRSDHESNLYTGALLGAIIGMSVMFLMYNLI